MIHLEGVRRRWSACKTAASALLLALSLAAPPALAKEEVTVEELAVTVDELAVTVDELAVTVTELAVTVTELAERNEALHKEAQAERERIRAEAQAERRVQQGETRSLGYTLNAIATVGAILAIFLGAVVVRWYTMERKVGDLAGEFRGFTRYYVAHLSAGGGPHGPCSAGGAQQGKGAAGGGEPKAQG